MKNANKGKLEGKVAIVTGASKGIGASIARHLAAEGAAVVVNYASSKGGADQVVDEIAKAGGKAIAVKADLSRKAEIEQLFAETKKKMGRLDILVNNAGVYDFAPIEGVTEEHFHRQFNLNVLGLILSTQEAVKYFGAEGGSVINISSLASTFTPPTSVVYSATKAAVDAVTLVLSKELGPRKIRVNAIRPGMVDTEGLRASEFSSEDTKKHFASLTPLGRLGVPQDVAPAAVFLAGPDASWITGETLVIAGGLR